MPNLNVPYLSQLDNRNNPYGSCNVTSMAMCMKYHCPHKNFGCPSTQQLEDFLYEFMSVRGLSRHSPYDLKKMVETFGFVDDFTSKGTFSGIRSAIDRGNPLVLAGYWTRFGHIIVVRGYEENGVRVNDPYGEAFYTPGSLPYYDTNKSGENLLYSWNMIASLCSPESASFPNDIWMHEIKKA